MGSEPTPGQLAHFDQAYTAVSRLLDDLITAHRDILAEAAAPWQVDLVGLGAFIREHADDTEALIELLAVAVHRLAAEARGYARAVADVHEKLFGCEDGGVVPPDAELPAGELMRLLGDVPQGRDVRTVIDE